MDGIENDLSPAAGGTSQYPMIIAFGDSLTERGSQVFPEGHECNRGVGWIALLGSSFHARADVVARGFSGYNTRIALASLPKALAGLHESATVVLVWFGANDSVLHGRGGQHVGLQEYALNLSKMVSEIQKFGAIPVLVTPPPLHQESADADGGGNSPGRRVNENTAKYAGACIEVAKRREVPCIDIYGRVSSHTKDQNGLKRLLNDGLHLSGDGNAFVARTIYAELQAQVPKLSESELVRWFPVWGKVDMNNPASSF
jgi:isoamyl acetate esterase